MHPADPEAPWKTALLTPSHLLPKSGGLRVFVAVRWRVSYLGPEQSLAQIGKFALTFTQHKLVRTDKLISCPSLLTQSQNSKKNVKNPACASAIGLVSAFQSKGHKSYF